MEKSLESNYTYGLPGEVQDYESVITDLVQELENLKGDYYSLKSNIVAVVTENQDLSRKVSSLLQEKCASMSTSRETEIVENLKQQLANLNKEKECSTQIWKNAVMTIDQLEEKLRTYQSSVPNLVPRRELTKLKQHYEHKIKEMELNAEKMREALNKKCAIYNEKLKDTLNQEKLALKEASSQTQNRLMASGDTNKNTSILQKKINVLNSKRKQLEETIQKQNAELNSLRILHRDSTLKVAEAVEILEYLFRERDQSLVEEKTAKDEMMKLSKSIIEVIEEKDSKYKQEVGNLKREHEDKLSSLSSQLLKANEEIAKKNADLEEYSKKCLQVEDEIHQIRRFGPMFTDESATSKLLILEKNLESTFQKLLVSERLNVVLNSEKESLQSDIEQMSKHFERDVKAREIEKMSLLNKVAKLERDLNEKAEDYLKILKLLEENKGKILNFEKDFKDKLTEKESNLRTSYLEDVEALQKDKFELEQQLEDQVNLNQKWRTTSKQIIEKLEKQIRHQHSALAKATKVNKKLEKKLQKILEEQSRREMVTSKTIEMYLANMPNLAINAEGERT